MMDPFTEVLQALWTLFETRADITALVKIGNRIKLWEGKLRADVKDPDSELTISDLPMIIIEPGGGNFNPIATSTDAKAVQIYRVRMMDGNLLLHKSYFPLKWAIFKALASADKLLDLNYVRQILVGDGTEDRNAEGHPGWTCGIDIQVSMWWSRTYLKTT